jgi:hypothetical protein
MPAVAERVMQNFALIFRLQKEAGDPDADEMAERMQSWSKWTNAIHEMGGELTGGNHLSSTEAKTIASGGEVANGPYIPANEYVAGYILIKARSIEHAVEIAKECPILEGEGNHVEVRALATPDGAN